MTTNNKLKTDNQSGKSVIITQPLLRLTNLRNTLPNYTKNL